MNTPAPLPAPPNCPHCGATMKDGAGVYSWTMGIVTIVAVHCIAPDCRKALHFQIVQTPGAEPNKIVGGFA
jgi:hypothetical protein